MSPTISRRAMVAASHPQAVEAGLQLLRHGGNAIDAAIATNAMLALGEPTGCGLGGDLFTLFWSAREQRLVGYNGSGRSPGLLTREHLLQVGPEIPAYGPLPISVPGCVEAWGEIHAAYGKMSFAACLEPAIELARRGVVIPTVIAGQWARGAEHLRRQPGFEQVFLPDGQCPRSGSLFLNTPLADTFERLAQEGWRDFYRGRIAAELVTFCADHDCALNGEDLKAHHGDWVEPVYSTYRGLKVWQLPPQGQGIAVLQMLNILEALDHHELDPHCSQSWHLFIEAKKLVYEDRARFYADPTFSKIPVAELLDKNYARRRAALIDPHRAAVDLLPGDPLLRQGGTVTLATADDEGNMVSWIQSNYMGFGSGLCPPRLGFGLQNRGRLFNLRDPAHPNAFAPNKRPFHTIIPGFVTRKGQPWLALGVMGGDYQPLGQTRILQLIHDHEYDLQTAGDALRMHHIGSSSPTGDKADPRGGTVLVENNTDATLRQQLEAMGHRVQEADALHFGGYQAIARAPDGSWQGASESRKDGRAEGY